MKNSESKKIFQQSCRLIPGGVNSPVRAFKSVDGMPFIVDSATGAYIRDCDNNNYLDYVMSWGPLILGHAYPEVIEAIQQKAAKGTSYGAPTKEELILASLVTERMPWIEKLRLVSSGTEACMTAARIARGVTGRDIIIKFDGCYHGHSDSFLVQAGSGLATGNLPGSAGIPEGITQNTISIPYNNIEVLRDCFTKFADSIAAVIIEPIAANMGVVPPKEGFLNELRKLTRENNSVLIFDEVITGFRVSAGGAAELYNIKPDLVTLGKILGGGLPIGAVGGRKELMDCLAPLGNVYQAGTLSGNPLSVTAGIETLKALANSDIYDHIKNYAEELIAGIRKSCHENNISLEINRVESLFTIFFSEKPITDFNSAKEADHQKYAKLFHELLNRGVYIAPSGYEAWFVSLAHQVEELQKTLQAVNEACQHL